MATWSELADDSIQAARLLFGEGHLRSASSRAYYASYAAMTDVLTSARRVTFARDRDNPSHAQLIRLVSDEVLRPMGFDPSRVKVMRKAIRYLRRYREVADYMPGMTLNANDAKNALRHAAAIQ